MSVDGASAQATDNVLFPGIRGFRRLTLRTLFHQLLGQLFPPMEVMVRRALLLILLQCLVLVGTIPGSAQTSPKSDATVQVQRLAALGRLWGTVKFFHPILAYKDIDWDAALVAAIPKVRAATSPDEFRAAVDGMLAVLGDPETRTVVDRNAAGAPAAADPPASAAPAYRMAGDVLIFRCEDMLRLFGQQGPNALRGMPAEADRAKAIGAIFDCRFQRPLSQFDAFLSRQVINEVIRNFAASMLDRPVTLATIRYRQHAGYNPQIGGPSSTYESSLVTTTPGVLAADRKDVRKIPIAALINEHSPLDDLLLSGLQGAGIARIVKEVGSRISDDTSVPFELVDGVTARVRAFELINPNGAPHLRPDIAIEASAIAAASEDVALKAAMASLTVPARRPEPNPSDLAIIPRSNFERPYSEMAFPNAEYRLLSLFRFWSVIDNFFAYKHLMDDDWSRILLEFIPKFEASRSALDYQLAVKTLSARLQDTHVGVQNTPAVENFLGLFAPPITLGWVEGQTVVAAVTDATFAAASQLKPGDIVLAIDDEPVQQRRARLGPLFAASTPQALEAIAHARLLRGPKGKPARLRVQGADGATRDVEAPRTAFWGAVGFPRPRTTPVFGILPSGHGYIDLARLRFDDADKALDAVLETPALIFDMRGYPNQTAWVLAPRLAKDERPFVGAQFHRPFQRGATSASTRLSFSPEFKPSSKPRYRGKVVMLIDERAISQAEYTCMLFAAATDVVFVGSPTNGANGDVTVVVLPGNLRVSFTGHDLRHADGRQLQRVGIQPHVKAAPTIDGIRENRDDILEAAVKYLQAAGGQ